MLLYKFRFITIPLLTPYKNLKSNSLQRAFNILLEEKYVDKKFDISYKIDRKPAIYFLSAKGIAVLKSDPRFNPRTLHSYYKNNSLANSLMQHCADTLAAYNVLTASYPNTFDIFTRQEIAYFDDLPTAKPDLYLRGATDYFVILAHDMQPYLVRKQLAAYIIHSEEEGWPRGDYPALLFVFGTVVRQQAFLEHAVRLLGSAGIGDDELRIGTTTMQALQATPATGAIWSFTDAPGAPRRLSE